MNSIPRSLVYFTIIVFPYFVCYTMIVVHFGFHLTLQFYSDKQQFDRDFMLSQYRNSTIYLPPTTKRLSQIQKMKLFSFQKSAFRNIN